ncbi:MAG: histidine phosphatase family protein [Chloroflexota bacterium]|nr:histidine phosphatase family protein [Chloroflexota bacterium]
MRVETTLYFVRHGESEANAARRFGGQTESPLTERGRGQSEAVAAALAEVRFDRVVSSDLSRARDTAAVIAARQGLEVEIHPGLREIDVGEATGKAWDELGDFPDWEESGFYQWRSGESLEQVLERSMAVVARLVADNEGRTICIVGHGGVTRILISHFLGLLPELERSAATNTNVTVVKTDGITYRVERLFGDAHMGKLAG